VREYNLDVAPRIPALSPSDQLAEVTLEARQELAAIQGYVEMLGEELADRPDVLSDLDRIHAAGDRLTQLVAVLEQQVANARNLASVDALTGIANRRAFFEIGEKAFEEEGPLCLVLLDLDRFKAINDAHGHLVGDEVLRAVVERCLRGIRNGDTLARLAGDEFVLLLPGSSKEVALAVARRLRARMTQQPVTTSAGLVTVTMSMGVAERSADTGSLRDLVEAADAQMYLVKRTGRDRVA